MKYENRHKVNSIVSILRCIEKEKVNIARLIESGCDFSLHEYLDGSGILVNSIYFDSDVISSPYKEIAEFALAKIEQKEKELLKILAPL